jgi:hypothetical protein
MTPVFQQVFGNPEKGDCMSACIATILDIPLEEVPQATLIEDESMNAFLGARGILKKAIWHDDLKPGCFDGMPKYFIAIVLSQARLVGEGFYHAVVGTFDGKIRIVHNPNPNAEAYPPNQALGVIFLTNKA